MVESLPDATTNSSPKPVSKAQRATFCCTTQSVPTKKREILFGRYTKSAKNNKELHRPNKKAGNFVGTVGYFLPVTILEHLELFSVALHKASIQE